MSSDEPGQLDVHPPRVDTSSFFASRKAAALLKHHILASYVVPFASKTGSRSRDGRVIVVDGYAGAGRYDDGTAGSPALLARAARAMPHRKVECVFVERDRATFDRLCQVLAAEDTSGLDLRTLHGGVEDHLGDIVGGADGAPLLLFLDPFGLGLSFDTLADLFARRGRDDATEVIFRFDASAVRRIRGALHSATQYPARQAQLEALDTAAGGAWWRDEDDAELDNVAYLEWFMERLLHLICARIGCSGWEADIRNRPDLQPAYYLFFLTRHPDGMEVFGEALSLAQDRWRRAVFDEALEAAGGPGLFTADELFAVEEKELGDRWIADIATNVRALLVDKPQFLVRSELQAIFGPHLGIAREKHLRAALKILALEEVTSSDSKGKLYGKHVVRAQPPTGAPV